MQTREPRKRVPWIFVFILIITIPLVIFGIVLLNTIPTEREDTSTYEQQQQGAVPADSIKPDSLAQTMEDSVRAE